MKRLYLNGTILTELLMSIFELDFDRKFNFFLEKVKQKKK